MVQTAQYFLVIFFKTAQACINCTKLHNFVEQEGPIKGRTKAFQRGANTIPSEVAR